MMKKAGISKDLRKDEQEKRIIIHEAFEDDEITIYESMLNYCMEIMIDTETFTKTKDNIKTYLVELSHELVFINELRKSSAHTEYINKKQAEFTIDLLVRVERVLCDLLEKIDMEKLKEKTTLIEH
jgi:hypothetical protein